MERDQVRYNNRDLFGHFNSHAHVERDNPPTLETNGYKNFNSHAHVERDITINLDNPEQSISTHTLTWSVTI